MSQLNNEELKEKKPKKEKKEKKKLKPFTKIVIFLCVFAFVCVGVTTCLIYIHNKNMKQEEPFVETKQEEKETYKIEDDGFGIKSLTERYVGNALNTETVEDGIGNRKPSHKYDTNTNKISINYFVIDGLKNEEIENKINKEIKDKVYSMFTQEELNNSDVDWINIYAYINANYGNVLSIDINKSINYFSTENEYNTNNYKREFLNFDLTTGNQITFRDLFTNKTSLKNVLIPAINKMLRSKHMDEGRTNEGMTVDFKKIDLSNLEEETYVVLNKIMNNIDNIKFGFDCRNINIMLDDEYLTIDMSTVYKNIAIYKRYLTTESIFDGKYDNLAKEAFVFTMIYNFDDGNLKKYYLNENIYDNLKVEIKIACSDNVFAEQEGKKLYDEYLKIVTDKLEKLKIEAKNNSSNYILYIAEYTIYGSEDKNLSQMGIKNLMTNTYGTSRVYRMTKEYYDKEFYNEMARQQREGGYYGGVSDVYFYYVDENNKNVTVEENREEYQSFDLYTNKTREQLIGINTLKQKLHNMQKEKERIEDGLKPYYNNVFMWHAEIDSTKSLYNLSDDDEEIKQIEQEAEKLIEEIQKLIEQKSKKEVDNGTEEKNDNNTDNKTIVGDWQYEDSIYIYHFNNDGTGTYMSTLGLTYTEKDGTVVITFDGNDNSFEGTWQGDTLNIIDSFGEDTIYHRK